MRQLHKIYAFWAGYFWLPCPLCNRPFGGHEITDKCCRQSARVQPRKELGVFYVMCPLCADELDEMEGGM